MDRTTTPGRIEGNSRAQSADYSIWHLQVMPTNSKSKQWSAATSALGPWKFRVGYWIFSLFWPAQWQPFL